MADHNSLASLLGMTATDESTGEVDLVAVVPWVYKHKKIASFATGEENPSRGLYRFEFRNHILTITGATQGEADRKNRAFLELAKGLMGVDKLNIVQMKVVDNEVTLDQARVVRGAVSTVDVADRADIPNPAAGTEGLADGGTPAPAKAPAAPIRPGFSFTPRT